MKYLYCITFLSLFKLFKFNWIHDGNCQKNRGECHKNKCYCYEEFWTLKNEEEGENIHGFTYCNYVRKSRLTPLLLEFFIPIGLSHYYWGSKKMFFLKLFLLCLPITLIIIGFCKFKNNNSQNPEQNIKNEEEINLMSHEESEANKEIKNEGNKLELYSSDDGNDNLDLSGKLHSANHKKVPINSFDCFILFVEGFFTICYFIMHITDMVGYSFGLYKDENNVPFANIF